METKTVIAIKPGYHGKLRAVGDKFPVPKDAKASWFVEEKPEGDKPARGRAKHEGDAEGLI